MLRRSGGWLAVLLSLLVLVGCTRTHWVKPTDPRIAYSHVAQVEPAGNGREVRFDRHIPSHYRRDSPGTRIRFRTDAPFVKVKLDYLRWGKPHNGRGLVRIDGEGAREFDWPQAWLGLRITRPGPRGDGHDYEIVLPYGTTVAFQGLELPRGSQLHEVKPSPASVRWLALGDSITQGFYASRVDRAYPHLVGERLGWEVINMGFVGRCVMPDDGEKTSKVRADVITVLLGVNDYQEHKGIDLFRADYRGLLANLRLAHPDAVLIAITPLPIRDESGDGLQRYRETIETEARAQGVPCIAGTELMTSDPSNFRDGLHPNDRGLSAVADALAERLAVVVNGKNPPASRD